MDATIDVSRRYAWAVATSQSAAATSSHFVASGNRNPRAAPITYQANNLRPDSCKANCPPLQSSHMEPHGPSSTAPGLRVAAPPSSVAPKSTATRCMPSTTSRNDDDGAAVSRSSAQDSSATVLATLPRRLGAWPTALGEADNIGDLKLKDFVARFPLTEAEVCAPGFLDRYMELAARAAPLAAFLARAADLPWE